MGTLAALTACSTAALSVAICATCGRRMATSALALGLGLAGGPALGVV